MGASELTTGVISQTDPLPPLDQRTKTEQCSLYVHTSGGGHVEGFCGRSRGTGVDCAVCRDERGLGAVASPALKLPTGPWLHPLRRPHCGLLGMRSLDPHGGACQRRASRTL